MLIITHQSHLDHGLTSRHLMFILNRFRDRDGFFADTVELPDDLEDLVCGLHGPVMGDAPIDDRDVMMRKRFGRTHESRILFGGKLRKTRILTVIAGPAEGGMCVLYTAHGGPLAPREPGDASIAPDSRELAESIAFWREHALSPFGAPVKQ